VGIRDFFRRHFQVRREDRLEFLHEQDGENERRLKDAIRPLLAEHQISRAYLARVAFDPSTSPSVALCLISPLGDDAALVERIATVFKAMASGGIFLDITFLSLEQEEDLRRVCPPFYIAT
jgi:hypothetical protein